MEQQQAEAHIALFEDRLEVMQTVARFEPDVWRTWMSDVLLDRSCPRLSRGGRRHARDYTDSSAPAIGDVDLSTRGCRSRPRWICRWLWRDARQPIALLVRTRRQQRRTGRRQRAPCERTHGGVAPGPPRPSARGLCLRHLLRFRPGRTARERSGFPLDIHRLWFLRKIEGTWLVTAQIAGYRDSAS